MARIRVAAGEQVRRGQVLAELDVTEVAAAVRQAREGLAKAERDRDRARTLADQDVVPRAVAEDAETATQVARAGVSGAEFNLRQAVLLAPGRRLGGRADGRAGRGGGAGPADPRVSGRGRGFVVRASLPDRDVVGLRVGQPALVAVDALPGAPLAGAVAEIARSASRATGTFEVEIRLAPARCGSAAGRPPGQGGDRPGAPGPGGGAAGGPGGRRREPGGGLRAGGGAGPAGASPDRLPARASRRCWPRGCRGWSG